MYVVQYNMTRWNFFKHKKYQELLFAIFGQVPYLSVRYRCFRPNKKRQKKNDKFGYGGQKKRSKSNTAESASDMSQFSRKKHGAINNKKYTNKNVRTSSPD